MGIGRLRHSMPLNGTMIVGGLRVGRYETAERLYERRTLWNRSEGSRPPANQNENAAEQQLEGRQSAEDKIWRL